MEYAAQPVGESQSVGRSQAVGWPPIVNNLPNWRNWLTEYQLSCFKQKLRRKLDLSFIYSYVKGLLTVGEDDWTNFSLLIGDAFTLDMLTEEEAEEMKERFLNTCV